MNYTKVESAKEICYEINFPSGLAKEDFHGLSCKAQDFFKQLVRDGETSLTAVGLIISEERFSRKDTSFCYKITTDKIEDLRVGEFFSSVGRAYATINLDTNRFSLIILKS